MELQLIRNATMRLKYGKNVFLTDPMFSEPGEIESWAGISPNPTVPLPMPVDALISGITAILLLKE